MIDLTQTLSLTSVKCSLAIWDYPYACPRSSEAFTRFSTWEERDDWKRWEAWDEDVIALFDKMRSLREARQEFPLLMPTIARNVARYDAWRVFCKSVTTPSLEQLQTISTELKAIVAVEEDFEWPPYCNDVYWLVENVVLNHLSRLNAELAELSDVSIAIGRTILMLGSLVEAKYLRRDQAGKLLGICLQTKHIGIPFEDLIWREEFASLIDEAPVDNVLISLIESVLVEEAIAVAQFKAGKEKALGSIIGKILKQVKADPRAVKELVIAKITG